MPAPPAEIPESRFVELAQLYGSYALVLNEDGEEFAPDPISWAETDLVQAIARQPGGRAWYVVDEPTLELEIRGRTVSDDDRGGARGRRDRSDDGRARLRAAGVLSLRRPRRRRASRIPSAG